MGNVFRSVLAAARAILQNKTVTAGTSNITVQADSGYDGLDTVTVQPTPTETKTVTPSTSAQTITPSAGKYISSVSVDAVSLTGDAGTGNVLSGKTYYKDSLTKQTGTMTNNGAVSQALNCGGSYTVPEGYHDGTGSVTANSLASQTGVDSGKTAVTAGAMLSGYQGWVNGSKVSGTISSKAAATYNTSSSDQTISSGQYLSGTQTIRAVTTSGISAANIKDGAVIKVGDAGSATRIANVTGTFTDASTVSSGQTAAAAAQIKSGYSAWVDGAEVKGSYTEPTIQTITPSDSSPVALATTGNYNPSATGYAIKNSPATLTPSNTSPPSIASGTIYRGGGTGKAIADIATNGNGVTPSASGQYFYSGWNRMTAAGYACTSQGATSKASTFTPSTSATTTVSLGFKPKYLAIIRPSSSTLADGGACRIDVYDETLSTSFHYYAAGSSYGKIYKLSDTTTDHLNSITSTGFVMNKVSNNQLWNYFAFG